MPTKTKPDTTCKGFNSSGCKYADKCNKSHHVHPYSINKDILNHLIKIQNDQKSYKELTSKWMNEMSESLAILKGQQDTILYLMNDSNDNASSLSPKHHGFYETYNESEINGNLSHDERNTPKHQNDLSNLLRLDSKLEKREKERNESFIQELGTRNYNINDKYESPEFKESPELKESPQFTDLQFTDDSDTFDSDPDLDSDRIIIQNEEDYYKIQDRKQELFYEFWNNAITFKHEAALFKDKELTPIDLFKKTMQKYYDVERNENYRINKTSYNNGDLLSVTRFAFMLWSLIISFDSDYEIADKQDLDLLLKLEQRLNDYNFRIYSGYEVVVFLENDLEDSDDIHKYNNFWNNKQKDLVEHLVNDMYEYQSQYRLFNDMDM